MEERYRAKVRAIPKHIKFRIPKKTPPLRGGVVIHDGLRKPEPESLFVQLF